MARTAIDFGIRPQQIQVLPYFLKAPLRLKPQANQPANTLVYFGRLSPEKGLLSLLQAMSQLPQIPLIVCGAGPQRPQLESFVVQHGLENVRFAGHLNGKALTSLLQSALFTILPSEWYEVFGQSIIESMALGKPVIAARIGGIPDLIDEGTDGLLFEPGNVAELVDCIEELWANEYRTQQMGENGRRKVLQSFSPRAHYEQLYALYARLGS